MVTTDKTLLRCSRWEKCGRETCQHYEPHYVQSLIIPTTGRSICFEEKCSGNYAKCKAVHPEPCWEV